MNKSIYQHLINNFDFNRINDLDYCNESFVYYFSKSIIENYDYELLTKFKSYYLNHPKLINRLLNYSIDKTSISTGASVEPFRFFLEISNNINHTHIEKAIKSSRSNYQKLENILPKLDISKIRPTVQYRLLNETFKRDIKEKRSLNHSITNLLIQHGFDLNSRSSSPKDFSHTFLSNFIINEYFDLIDEPISWLITKGANPFVQIYVNISTAKSPSDLVTMNLLHYYFLQTRPGILITNINQLKYTLKLIPNLNTLDNWGRNILHMLLMNNKFEYQGHYELYDSLVEAGVDPNHKATINNQEIVVKAKMKGELPKYYGQSPKEILNNQYINNSNRH